MATNRTYLTQFAKVIRDHKSVNGGMQVSRYVRLRDLLEDETDRQLFSTAVDADSVEICVQLQNEVRLMFELFLMNNQENLQTILANLCNPNSLHIL